MELGLQGVVAYIGLSLSTSINIIMGLLGFSTREHIICTFPLTSGNACAYTHTHTRAHTQPDKRTHARARAHARTHAHTRTCT